MGNIPKYQEIINYIQEQIENKIYSGDSQLPTEEALAKQFHTSRPTVVKAMEKLRDLNVVYRVQGKGSFVRSEKKLLGSQDSKVISVVLPFAQYRDAARLDEMNILKGLARLLDRFGYFTMIHYCKDNDEDFIKTVQAVRQSVSIGTIAYVAKGLLDCPEIYDLFMGDYPVVLVDKPIMGSNCPCVRSDNVKGAIMAVDHLVDCGYHHIYFLSDFNATYNESLRERYVGFCQGVQKHKAHNNAFGHFILGSQDEDQTELNNVIKQLMLKHKNERVGIFCTGDYLAIKTYNALLEASADAPKNFGVIGFDGLGLKAADNSTLTTMSQDYYNIGKVASETMLKLLSNTPVPNDIIKLDVTLQEGTTTIKL